MTFSDLSWSDVTERARVAEAQGALEPLPTDAVVMPDNGIPFVVRVLLPQLNREDGKPRNWEQGADSEPFLPPYDANLFVADLSPTHVCLLNKYVVLPGHLLLVTRDFTPQDTWLTEADFQAMWLALRQWPGLVFFNGGRRAGASQRHRHLQLVHPPLGPVEPPVPITAAFAGLLDSDAPRRAPLPFLHALTRLEPDWTADPDEAARATLERYERLLDELDLRTGGFWPHNMLATREWLLVVPRRREEHAEISVNAVGFAGGLLVSDEAALARVREIGPLALLQEVGVPA